MSHYHVVKDGDCLDSIADLSGHFWQTIWESDENAELRSKRSDHNSLNVGDKVFVPELRHKDEQRSTSARHRFKRKGIPCKLAVQIQGADGKPLANAAYKLTIDGVQRDGKTDGDGFVRETISAQAQVGSLVIPAEEDDDDEEGAPEDQVFSLALGALPPHDLLVGAQARLRNLGWTEVEPTGDLDDATRKALEQFRAANDLPVANTLDHAAAEALKTAHGS